MAVDIRELFLSEDDEGSKEYKAGWSDAVCWVMQNYNITARNGEPIQIGFNINLDEELIIKKVMEIEDGKSKK